jgi:hypothetical protein
VPPLLRIPQCAESSGLTSEREQKDEQHLERRENFRFTLRHAHVGLDVSRRFTEEEKTHFSAPSAALCGLCVELLQLLRKG